MKLIKVDNSVYCVMEDSLLIKGSKKEATEYLLDLGVAQQTLDEIETAFDSEGANAVSFGVLLNWVTIGYEDVSGLADKLRIA